MPYRDQPYPWTGGHEASEGFEHAPLSHDAMPASDPPSFGCIGQQALMLRPFCAVGLEHGCCEVRSKILFVGR